MNPSDADIQRRHVVFHGRVQGVGFRFRTHEVARRHPVVGFVENQPDGTVLLVVEGQNGAIERLIEEVRSTMSGYIHSHSATDHPTTGEFLEFTIRR